ncbi:hypothetical protein FJTKL_07246 [Diaporthe vaccinii]|uniref:Ankyrin repeat protein n=1 Tax=Diaporthe vaccinii TaxID=105482 RepID=A0ABR4EU71_9PEZI
MRSWLHLADGWHPPASTDLTWHRALVEHLPRSTTFTSNQITSRSLERLEPSTHTASTTSYCRKIGNMSDNQDNSGPGPDPSAAQALPPEAIELASRMYNAARQGDTELLTQAISAGLPPNLTNDKGDTLLMLAAYHGHADLVKFLVQQGADPNRLNDRQQSPLAGAVFKKEDDVIEALVEGGADPEYGAPSALECISIFKQEDRWRARFESAPGRGKATPKEGQ